MMTTTITISNNVNPEHFITNLLAINYALDALKQGFKADCSITGTCFRDYRMLTPPPGFYFFDFLFLDMTK